MSWNGKKALRAAVGAALSATLALGGAMPSVALAADPGDRTGTGTLTITAAEGNNVTKYKAVKIFDADVYQEGGKWVASDLGWATKNGTVNTGVQNAVRLAIRSADSAYTVNDAQDAADFLIANITGTNNTTMVPAGSFANTLANTIATAMAVDNTVTADAEITPGTATTLTEGYYLIIVDPSVLNTGASATSPILLMMGDGQSIAMAEKVTVPTVEKSVGEDATTAAQKTVRYADAQIGQELPFTLTGTVAGNIDSYTNYRYVFTDTLSKGLDLKVSGGENTSAFDQKDITVKVATSVTDNTHTPATTTTTTYTLTEGFSAVYGQNTQDITKHDLVVTFADLKGTAVKGKINNSGDAVDVPINSTSVVTVEYRASLNKDAVLGTTVGNPNEVSIEYSNVPNQDFTGKTTTTDAKVYTYGLRLLKRDKDHEVDGIDGNSVPLEGAKFTIQAKTTDEGTNNGKYLLSTAADAGKFGTKTTQPTASDTDYLFTTAADGSFSVNGLDAGTYTIHEVTPPAGYDGIVGDIELTITANKHETTLLPGSVTTTVQGGEEGTGASYNSETGVVTLTATNKKQEELPLTGLPGITMVYVVGGAILAVSLVVIVRRRINEKE